MRLLYIHIFTVCILFGCNNEKERPYDKLNKVKDQAKITIDRLYLEQAKITTEKDVEQYLTKNELFKKYFMDEVYPPDVQKKEILKLVTTESGQQLLSDVQRVFKSVEGIEKDFTLALTKLKSYYPDYTIPKIQMAVTGFMKDVVVVDDYILICPEFFPDDESKYRQPEMPDYLLKRYSKESMTPMVLFFLSNKFNDVDVQDETLIANMVAHGKALYFTKQMCLEKHDSLIIGYSQEQLDFCEQFEEQIWDHFLRKQLVYSTEHNHVVKYIQENPKIGEIDNRCPGRIAQWLGWRIVEKYMMDHPEVSLQSLMSMSDGKELFMQSKYRPKAQD